VINEKAFDFLACFYCDFADSGKGFTFEQLYEAVFQNQ